MAVVAGGGGIVHGAHGDVAAETMMISTMMTELSSAAVHGLLDEQNDGGVVVHPSLVHAL